MNAPQVLVKRFRKEIANMLDPHLPKMPPYAERRSEIVAIRHELDAVDDALEGWDLTQLTTEMAELVYAVYGLACACGLDLFPIISELHRARMCGTTPEIAPLLRNQTMTGID
jgi:Phosphoribosyl-ATP pyrophosphohydrolase